MGSFFSVTGDRLTHGRGAVMHEAEEYQAESFLEGVVGPETHLPCILAPPFGDNSVTPGGVREILASHVVPHRR